MVRSWTAKFLVIAMLAMPSAGCDDETPTPTTPNPAPTVTETFTGNVTQNGAQTHTFAVAAAGSVTATLKQVAPDSALVIGFSLGAWNSTTSACQIVQAKDDATVGVALGGNTSGALSLCVRVYDVGNITAAVPAAYTVEVVHP